MTEHLSAAATLVLIGSGATAFIDVWALLRQRWLGVPPPNYGLVGRWLAYLPRGRFVHRPISASPPIAAERLIGWLAHYVIGIAFASALLLGWGMDWARHPTLAPALMVGLVSVAAPFLLMQPGMGSGIAARLTPRPGLARMHSLLTHGLFGVGLYLSAELHLWISHQSPILHP